MKANTNQENIPQHPQISNPHSSAVAGDGSTLITSHDNAVLSPEVPAEGFKIMPSQTNKAYDSMHSPNDYVNQRGPNGDMSLEVVQEKSQEHYKIKNTEVLEVPGNVNVVSFESDLESNYNVDSIVEWMGRLRLHRTFNSTTTTDYVPVLDIAKATAATQAQGKLDFFRFFRCDWEITLRWNCPKTTFGAFVLFADYGDQIAYSTPPYDIPNANDFASIKSFSALQGSSCSIQMPFMYPVPFFDNVLSDWRMGYAFLRWLVPATSVTDFTPTVTFHVYVRCVNVSIMTPFPASIIPQGGMVSMFNSTSGASSAATGALGLVQGAQNIGANRPIFQPSGHSVIRTFNEGLNLMRQEGFDPAPPANREAIPLVPCGDKMAIVDYHQLGDIPSYAPVEINTGYNFSFILNHAWLDRIRLIHPYVRADFWVTLHFVGTPFHSGRLRIIYLPTSSTVSTDIGDRTMGASILWDVQDSSSISFSIPYGANLEYNQFPYIHIREDVPFVSPFTSTIPPYFVMEKRMSNIKVMGYTNNSPNPYPPVPIPDWSRRWGNVLLAAAPLSLPLRQAMEKYGFYHATHTSDNESNTSIRSTARRPGQWLGQRVGNFVFTPFLDLLGEASVVNNNLVPITHFMDAFAGFRGSIKVSVIMDDPTNPIRLTPMFDGQNRGGGFVTGNGLCEIVIPYMTPMMFVGSVLDNIYPAVAIDTPAAGTFDLYISFLDDFELLMPCAPRPVVARTVPPIAAAKAVDEETTEEPTSTEEKRAQFVTTSAGMSTAIA